MTTATCQLTPAQMEEALQAMAATVAQGLGPDEPLVLLGIRSRGLPLAERLGALL
jgi:pyrimidine operon attenuation protein/uracil phosphoribosyltransferase